MHTQEDYNFLLSLYLQRSLTFCVMYKDFVVSYCNSRRKHLPYYHRTVSAKVQFVGQFRVIRRQNDLTFQLSELKLSNFGITEHNCCLWISKRRSVTTERGCENLFCNAFLLNSYFQMLSVLILGGVELNFFIVASTGICFGFMLKIMLVTQGLCHYS